MGACASVPKAMRRKFSAAAPPPEQPKEEETTAVVRKEGGEADDDKKKEKAVEETTDEKRKSLEGEAPSEKESKDLKAEILPVEGSAAEKSTTDATPAAPPSSAVAAA